MTQALQLGIVLLSTVCLVISLWSFSKLMVQFDALKAEVDRAVAATAAAVTALHAALANSANVVDPAAVDAVTAALKASTDALTAALPAVAPPAP